MAKVSPPRPAANLPDRTMFPRRGALRYVIFGVAAAAICVFLAPLFTRLLPVTRHLLVGPGEYVTSGSMVPGGLRRALGAPPSGATPSTGLGSFVAGDADLGEFSSNYFPAPEELTFLIAGNPNAEGILMALEDRSGATIRLRSRYDPQDNWQRVHWSIPDEWQGRAVRLRVQDKATVGGGWIGFTLPESGPGGPAPISQTALVILILVVVQAVFFLLPGLAAALLCTNVLPLDSLRFAVIALMASAAVGYPIFFIYLFSPSAGRFISLLVLFAAGLCALLKLRKSRQLRQLARPFLACAVLLVLVSCFYSGLEHIYRYKAEPGEQAQWRFVGWMLPFDNNLPLMLAARLYEGVPVQPFLVGDWQSSDRPPLQSGIILMQFPLWIAFLPDLYYQCLGTVVQCVWAPAIWLLLTFAAVPPRMKAMVLAACVLSGFFLLHSTFVWPKLLSAWLFLLAMAVSPLVDNQRRWTRLNVCIASTAIALGLLSHGGIIFSVIASVLLLLFRRRWWPSAKDIGWAALLLLLWMLPWTMYQKFYDPPGDRLLKWHLAGVSHIDPRPFSTVFHEAYLRLMPEIFLDRKVDNFLTLFGPVQSYRALVSSPPAEAVRALLANNFFYTFHALGLLNIGFIAAVLRWRTGASGQSSSVENRLLGIALLTLFVWCLLMFERAATIIHSGSLATMVLLFMGLTIKLARLSLSLTIAVLGVNGLILFPLFIFGKPLFLDPAPGSLLASDFHLDMAVLALLALAGLTAWVRAGFAEPREELTAAKALSHAPGKAHRKAR